MSNEIVVGHVGWSTDFESIDTRTNQLRQLIDDGRLKLAPRLAPNGAVVSIDVVGVEMSEAEAPQPVDLSPDTPPQWDPGKLLSFGESQQVTFTYTNWKGETKQRRAVMQSLYWGSNDYHKESQWLVEGYDMDKEAVRTYALRDISDVRPI